jgi:hypothetical protein
LQGIVRGVDSTSFSVEGCGGVDAPGTGAGGAGGEGGSGGNSPGGAGGTGGDCENDVWTVRAVAPELVIPVETAMRVNVAYAVWCQPFSGCSETVTVRDALADGEPTLLAMYRAQFGAHTGSVGNPLEWPVALELVDLECFPPNVPNQPNRGPTLWALRMTGRANPEASVLLHAGESGELALDAGSDERWLAYNKGTSDAGGYDASSSLYFYLAKQR